jgi:hypothetical protein
MFALQFGDPELVVPVSSNSKFYLFSHLLQADEVDKFHYD